MKKWVPTTNSTQTTFNQPRLACKFFIRPLLKPKGPPSRPGGMAHCRTRHRPFASFFQFIGYFFFFCYLFSICYVVFDYSLFDFLVNVRVVQLRQVLSQFNLTRFHFFSIQPVFVFYDVQLFQDLCQVQLLGEISQVLLPTLANLFANSDL